MTPDITQSNGVTVRATLHSKSMLDTSKGNPKFYLANIAKVQSSTNLGKEIRTESSKDPSAR